MQGARWPNSSRRHVPAPLNRSPFVLQCAIANLIISVCDLKKGWLSSSSFETGIAEGYKDQSGQLTGQFGVDQPVTYAEVLKMALQAAGAKLSGGTPRNPSAQNTWASAYVKQAEDDHLSVFVPTLDVNAPATRAR